MSDSAVPWRLRERNYKMKHDFEKLRKADDMLRSFSKRKSRGLDRYILPVPRQIKSWRKANRKMAWGIQKLEFDRIEAPASGFK